MANYRMITHWQQKAQDNIEIGNEMRSIAYSLLVLTEQMGFLTWQSSQEELKRKSNNGI